MLINKYKQVNTNKIQNKNINIIKHHPIEILLIIKKNLFASLIMILNILYQN